MIKKDHEQFQRDIKDMLEKSINPMNRSDIYILKSNVPTTLLSY